MKSASNPEITSLIRDDILLARTRTFPVCVVEYLDDDGVWKELENTLSVTVNIDSLKGNFGEASFVPSASNISLSLANIGDIYTPESGNDLDHVLVKNRQVRVYMGYSIMEDNESYLLQEDGFRLLTEDGDNILVTSTELIPMGIYFLDDPDIQNEYGNLGISSTGRDAFKRAMENNISSKTYSGTDVGEILRDYCTLTGMPTSTALIPNLGTTVTVSDVGDLTNVKGVDAINKLMSYINAVVGGYRIFINDDGNAELRAIPTNFTAVDYEMDYYNHIISTGYTYLSNDSINRVDIFRKDHTVASATTLATTTKTSFGSFTTSWVGDAVYLSLEVEFNDSDSSVDLVVDQVNLTSITYSIIGGGAVDVDITIRGNLLNATPPFVGSAIAFNLHKNKDGITRKIVNPFVQSNTEARQIAENIIENYGLTNNLELTVPVPGNPLLEPNDRVMVTDLNGQKKNLYSVRSLSHTFNYDQAQFKSSVKMKYSGVSVANQIGDLLQETGDALLTENSDTLRLD